MAKKKPQPPPDPTPIMLETIQEIPATPEGQQAALGLERRLLADFARGYDSPFGFSCFYEVVHGNKLPEHCREWVEQRYEAHKIGKGSLDFAWRGSWKTTTLSVTFKAF